MAKKKDQKKGVFCLEGPWWGVKDRTSMEPVLRLLEKLKNYKVPYLRDASSTSVPAAPPPPTDAS